MQPSDDHHDAVTFSTPFLYTGMAFAGTPEFVDCADRGDTLQGPCRQLKVCVTARTTTRDIVNVHLDGTNFVEGEASDSSDLFQWLIDGVCNVVAADHIVYNVTRLREMGYISPFVVSSVLHSKEPLALMTRGDDTCQFGDLVNWVLRALMTAEAKNITKETAHLFPTTTVFGNHFEHLFFDAIAAVGNYGELYSRAFGEAKPRSAMNTLYILGGLNDVDNSGLMYSFPFGSTELDLPVDIVPPGPVGNGTLESIETRSLLRCGIVGGRPGFAEYSASFAEWVGLDAEFCRGLGAALFTQEADQFVAFVEYPNIAEAFLGLAHDEVDVLSGAPFNMENDVKEPTTGLGFAFGPIYYYGDVVNDEGNNNKEALTLALATREDDVQWSDFVRWTTMSTIYAEEEGITNTSASEMPVVDLFGSSYRQAFRDVILTVGHYGNIYNRNLESYIPRSHRNLLNQGDSPQLNPSWDFESV